jgi:hypothetical protein
MSVGGGAASVNDQFGYIVVTPSLANDSPVAWYSTNNGTTGYVPVTATTMASPFPITYATSLKNTATGVSTFTGVSTNTPYSGAQLTATSTGGPAVSGRVVSVGISIQYSADEYLRGGTYYLYSDPNHANCNAIAPNTLGSIAETKVVRITERKEFMMCAGVTEDEWSYYNLQSYDSGAVAPEVYPFGQSQLLSAGQTTTTASTTTGAYGFTSSAPASGAPMCILIAPSSPSTHMAQFEVEIVQHIEFVGTAATAMCTANTADSVGFETVVAAAAQLPARQMANPQESNEKSMYAAIRDELAHLAPHMARAAGKFAAGYAGARGVGASLERWAG